MADEIEVLGCVARRPTDTLLRELEQGDASAYGYEVREMARELLAARAALAAADALAAMVRSGRACPEHAAAVPREWCSACAVAGESAAVLVAANAYRAARGAR